MIQRQRQYDLDHLKVALILLVIAHHAGQPYGGSNGFWYFKSSLEGISLGSFFSVNAAFFMSLFFFISAYFMPQSYDRKGAKRFLAERFTRLGLPLLFGFFIMVPLLMYTYYLHFRDYEARSFWDYYLNVYLGMEGIPSDWTGPSWPDLQFAHLWFIEHLLFYAVVYVLLRKLIGRSQTGMNPSIPNKLSQAAIITFAIVVAAVTYLVRIAYQIDEWTGFLGVIQAEYAHVPQYAAFFAAGIAASRRSWLQTLSARAGRAWLTLGLMLALARYTGWISFYEQGGAGLSSFAYALYETFLCTSLVIGLLYVFRDHGSRERKYTKLLSKHAFTVYVIHVPVIVALQFAFQDSSESALVQFVLVTVAASILSFLLSILLHQLGHYMKRIAARKGS